MAALTCAALPGSAAVGAAPGDGHVIDTFAGTGDPGNSGDGGPARHAHLFRPTDVATAPDGTVYVVSGLTIRAVDPKTGRIRTVAGTGKDGFSGDGGPATEARFGDADELYGLSGIDVGPDGTLYIADAGNHRVRAVDPETKRIRTVAGIGKSKGEEHFAGDGGPATEATLEYPRDVAVAKDGTVYVNDALNYRIRAIDPETKRIRTVAGADDADEDGHRATRTEVEATGIAVHGGLVYLAEDEDDRVRVVDPDKDTIETVAGRGAATSYLANPTDVAVHGDTLYIAANDVFATEAADNSVYAFDLKKKRLTEFAGGNEGPGLGDGGDPKDAYLGGPGPGGVMGIATGRDGAVYITDGVNNRVRVVREGEPGAHAKSHRLARKPITTLLGSGKPWTRQAVEEKNDEEDGVFYRDVHDLDEVDLDDPSSVAVGKDGTVYVADTDNNRIRVLEPDDDQVRTLAGQAELPDADEGDGDGGDATDAYLHRPRGLVLGPGGKRLYFTDTETDDASVRYVDLEEDTVHTVPGSKYELDEPTDLAVDRRGTLYVAESGDGRVCRLRPGAEKCATVVGEDDDAAGGPTRPVSVAVSPEGTLYVADAATFRVRAYDLETGAVRTVAGIYARGGLSGDGGPGSSAQLGSPAGIDVTSDGTLYITDQANHRVRAVDPKTGVITTVVGKGHFEQGATRGLTYGGGGFSGDGGTAGKAELNNPGGVEVGPDGVLYIADTGNDRVRVVGDVDLSARGGVGPLPFVVGALLVLAALAAGYLYLRRRRRKVTADV